MTIRTIATPHDHDPSAVDPARAANDAGAAHAAQPESWPTPDAVALDTIPAETRWLCVELARQARDFYPDRDWAGIAPIVQRIWQREPRGIDWTMAAPMIHAAWQRR